MATKQTIKARTCERISIQSTINEDKNKIGNRNKIILAVTLEIELFKTGLLSNSSRIGKLIV